jgi:spermidine/putrescine-binding protein
MGTGRGAVLSDRVRASKEDIAMTEDKRRDTLPLLWPGEGAYLSGPVWLIVRDAHNKQLSPRTSSCGEKVGE